jgi:hypothetical protein
VNYLQTEILSLDQRIADRKNMIRNQLQPQKQATKAFLQATQDKFIVAEQVMSKFKFKANESSKEIQQAEEKCIGVLKECQRDIEKLEGDKVQLEKEFYSQTHNLIYKVSHFLFTFLLLDYPE